MTRQVLFAGGATPTRRKDSAGNTLLHTACSLRSERLVQLLIAQKARAIAH